MSRKSVSVGLTGALLLVTALFQTAHAAVPRPAAPFTLAWNSSTNYGISGFEVHYGLAGSTTTNRLDVGAATSVRFSNLMSQVNYFFFVVAYTPIGTKSKPSATLFYTPPVISRLGVVKLNNGARRIRTRAAPGTVCRIETTPSLKPPQWQLLRSVTADANGNVVTDDSRNLPMSFYRAVVQ